MLKFKTVKHIILYLIVIFISSCTNEVEYSPIPAIEFKEIKLYKNLQGNDSLIKIVINYIDGDGDLGLDQKDTMAPFDSIYYYNLFIHYYETIDGEFKQVVSPFTNDTIRFYYRFPLLTPNSNNKAIKGTIEFPVSDLSSLISINNPIKFRIHIIDRALHKSNVIETDPINFYP